MSTTIDHIFALIAKKHLFIETLETRHSDRLDFDDVAVWSVRDALEAAFKAGVELGAYMPKAREAEIAQDRFVAQAKQILLGFTAKQRPHHHPATNQDHIMTIQLNPTQHAVLTHAAQNTNGKITWFPDNVKDGARQKVLTSLFNRALITNNGAVPENSQRTFAMNHHLRTVSLSGARRIQFLAVLKWVVLVLPVAIVVKRLGLQPEVFFVVFLSLLAFGGLRAWETSRRRQFIRESRFPPFLVTKLRARYPQLSVGDADLVLRGLRQFFLAYLRCGRQFVAMPSQVVDFAWHEFILHTRAYQLWCDAAFGKLLHHTPAEVLGRDPKRNDGLRRTWYWACKEESINPRQPSRLPLLFALDKKFAIAGGFVYVPDCRNIDQQSGSDAYCGSSFGGGDGGSSAGDADGFGGSESSGADGSDGDGGGCGGGCGGD